MSKDIFDARTPEDVIIALEFGANINELRNHKTPIEKAAENDNVEVFYTLLENGAIDKRDGHFYTIYYAITNGSRNILNEYLRNPNLQYTPNMPILNSGIRALTLAVEKGYVDIVELLLAYNVEINYIDTSINNTPLGLACIKNDRIIVTLLLGKSADPNLYYKTPSFFYTKDINIVHETFIYGANLSDVDHLGRTFLYIAVLHPEIEFLEAILKYNLIDINHIDKQGQTVLIKHIIFSTKNNESFYNKIKMLLEFGADPTIQDNLGRDSIYYANMMIRNRRVGEQILNILDPIKYDDEQADF